MIDAFEALRNSDSSGYHNGTTIKFETGPNDDPIPRKPQKHNSFGVKRRRLTVVRGFIEARRVEGLQ
jgi:hypothetical protein